MRVPMLLNGFLLSCTLVGQVLAGPVGKPDHKAIQSNAFIPAKPTPPPFGSPKRTIRMKPSRSKGKLLKREEALKDSLIPKKKLTLSYDAIQPGSGNLINGIVDISSEHPVVSLEHLKDHVETVDVFGKRKGRISIKFKTPQDLSTAKALWKWDDSKPDYFIAIVQWGTGTEFWEDPFNITKIVPGVGAEKDVGVDLVATKISWKETGKFTFNIKGANEGNQAPAIPQKVVPQRATKVKRDAHATGWTFDLNSEKYGIPKEFNILKLGNETMGAKLDCVECYTKGSMALSVEVVTDGTDVLKAVADLKSSRLEAKVSLEASISATQSKEFKRQIVNIPISPFTILFLTVGPSVDLTLYKKFELNEKFTIGAEFSATMEPKSFHLDLKDSKKNHFDKLDPKVERNIYAKGEIVLDGTAGLIVSPSVKVDVAGSGFKSGVGFWLPKVTYQIGVAADTRGKVCEKRKEKRAVQYPISDKKSQAQLAADKSTDMKETKFAPSVALFASAKAGFKVEFYGIQGYGLFEKWGTKPWAPEKLDQQWPIVNLCTEFQVGPKSWFKPRSAPPLPFSLDDIDEADSQGLSWPFLRLVIVNSTPEPLCPGSANLQNGYWATPAATCISPGGLGDFYVTSGTTGHITLGWDWFFARENVAKVGVTNPVPQGAKDPVIFFRVKKKVYEKESEFTAEPKVSFFKANLLKGGPGKKLAVWEIK